MNLIADTHSHTIASGHAYSTIREMVAAASQKGIELLAITEHAPNMPGTCHPIYFQNLNVIPRTMNGIQVLFGAEVNILNPEGDIDFSEEICKKLDIVIASIHPPCYGLDRTEKENTNAYIEVMKKPYVNIIGHPDDSRYKANFETLVKTAKLTNTLIEVNNSSLRPDGFRKGARENILQILDLCKQYEVPVTTGSDAHIDIDAGNFTYVREVFQYCNFPSELIVTTSIEKLKPFLNIYKK